MRIVPPVFWLIGIVYILLIKTVDPFSGQLPVSIKWAGLTVFILGVIPVVMTATKFARLKTQIHTFKTPSSLSTSGWFRFSRNPIYLSQTISLFGLTLYTASPLGLIAPLGFFLLCNYNYVPYEEANLEKVFGQDYLDYKNRVGRWI